MRTIEQLVAHARELKDRYGFTSHKLKGGVFAPEYELECYRAVAAALKGDTFRFDPNAVWTAEQADDWRAAWPGFSGTRYEAKAKREGRVPCYLIFRKTSE